MAIKQVRYCVDHSIFDAIKLVEYVKRCSSKNQRKDKWTIYLFIYFLKNHR